MAARPSTMTSVSGIAFLLAFATLRFVFLFPVPLLAQDTGSPKFHVHSQRLQGTLEKLSEFGRNPEGGVTRLGFSQTELGARTYVMELLKSDGVEVRVYPAGSIFGRRPGTAPLPTLLFGSHIASVLR